MPNNWGPHFIVPTSAIAKYSGSVKLRETLDQALLAKELGELGLPNKVVKIINPWYCRKKGAETWVKVGESDDVQQNFPVAWDTTKLANGQYEILGLMHVVVRNGNHEHVIARQGINQVIVAN